MELRLTAPLATDATQLAAAVAQQLSATSVPDAGGRQTSVADAVATIERKANIDDVNRSLLEVNRELALRPTLTELNRVVGEQSLIMESLCSEHLLGRWIWKSGRTKGEKHLVPWNVQNINTNPENFTWEKDKTVIVTAAPGLYEVTFGFFTKRKPQVIALRVEFHTRPHTSHARTSPYFYRCNSSSTASRCSRRSTRRRTPSTTRRAASPPSARTRRAT